MQSNSNSKVHPEEVFQRCADIAEDDFWQGIFINLSKGAAPNGVYVNNGSLCCSYKNKEFSYVFDSPDKEIANIYKDIKLIFQEKMNVLSTAERRDRLSKFNDIQSALTKRRIKWSDIRKKSIKDGILERWVLEQTRPFKFSRQHTMRILSTIKMYINFRLIKSEDINYVNSTITGINGVSFTKDGLVTEKDLTDLAADKIDEDDATSSKNIRVAWDKYVHSLLCQNNIEKNAPEDSKPPRKSKKKRDTA